MPAIGYIQVHAFASIAQMPLEDVAVAVTTTEEEVLALRLTNESGLIEPVPIAVPNLAESQTPNPDQLPFARVNLYARLEGYEQIEALDVQVFAGTVTLQELEMIPLSELPDAWDEVEIFRTPAQNL